MDFKESATCNFTCEGFEIGMRTVASGNPGGSKGWGVGWGDVEVGGEGGEEVVWGKD